MAKKSMLAKTLKTISTEITGEALQLKINNAVWLNLLSDFEMTQSKWAEEFSENEVIASLKLLTSVLKANGYHYTIEDLAANTDQVELLAFVVDYQKALFESNEEKEHDDTKK